jgi:hypothetical protein
VAKALDVILEHAPGLGQLHGPLQAIEHLDAELPPSRPRAAQGGLAQVETVGGPSKLFARATARKTSNCRNECVIGCLSAIRTRIAPQRPAYSRIMARVPRR